MTFLSRRISGTLPAGDFLRQTFDDGGLAHAGFAEQHRVVLRAAAKNLDDALDLVFAADHGIHLAFAREFREVAAKRAQRRSLDFLSASRGLGRAFLLGFRRGEIRIEFLEDFVARPLDIDFEIFQHARGDAFAFAQQARAEYARCRRRNG